MIKQNYNWTISIFILGDKLNNTTYQHPINKTQELPFLSSTHVQESKGTGLVHTSPAHGPEDFLVSLSHKIPVVSFYF